MEWGNLLNWLSGGTRDSEQAQMRYAWAEVEELWRASPLAKHDVWDLADALMTEQIRRADRVPLAPLLNTLCDATSAILWDEHIGVVSPIWSVLDNDIAEAVYFRKYLQRRRRWAADYDATFGIVRTRFFALYDAIFAALPEACFERHDNLAGGLEVPLIELLGQPAEVVEALYSFPYGDDIIRRELFAPLREQVLANILVASGFQPDADWEAVQHRLKHAHDLKGKTGTELADLYLRHTPLRPILEYPVAFAVPEQSRFEHTHIVGGTGHGKTQLLQRLIHADLVAAQEDGRSVVVVDSQGDLINKLIRLDLFDPDTPGSLANRLVLIDPADIEFPAALNLFDAHLDRLADYRPVDRERVLNGVVELYEVFFGALLGAELTQKQGVIFRYLARLMVSMEGATIHTLMRLMEDGRSLKPAMEKLDGSARYFFETEFFHPSFAATKKQILRRLWGVLSTPAFERMFAQRQNKLDLFEAMQDGKIILVSTAKDLLKEEGSALFGRFFIAMLAQAALERSTVPETERTPTFVYVDEAQEYFDDRIETLLTQARKQKVASFSETLDHEPMWAHYADGFEGICIRYNFRKLLRSLTDEVEFVRMSYNETPPVLLRDKKTAEQRAKHVLSTKSLRWATEREWRLMRPSSGKAVYAERNCVSRIYLGSRISEANRAEVVRVARKLHIPVFAMELDQYALEYKRVETPKLAKAKATKPSRKANLKPAKAAKAKVRLKG